MSLQDHVDRTIAESMELTEDIHNLAMMPGNAPAIMAKLAALTGVLRRQERLIEGYEPGTLRCQF